MEEKRKGQDEAKTDEKSVKSPGRKPIEGRVIRGTKGMQCLLVCIN